MNIMTSAPVLSSCTSGYVGEIVAIGPRNDFDGSENGSLQGSNADVE